MTVDHLSFEVRPDEVTGFLGPNGAGKSPTMFRGAPGVELVCALTSTGWPAKTTLLVAV